MNRIVVSWMIIICLLMQISWASAADYATHCEHQSLNHHTNHLAATDEPLHDPLANKREHSNEHNHEQPVNSGSTVDVNSTSSVECDCSACHAPTVFASVNALNINLTALSIDANTLLAGAVSSPTCSRPERPNWIGRA